MADTIQPEIVSNDASPRGSLVRFCAWCKEVSISGHRATDFLSVWGCGSTVKAMVNGREIIVGDTMCPSCRQEKFPETVKKENSNDQVKSF